MATATATGVERGGAKPAIDRDQFRAALDQALLSADADERVGPVIGATGLRLRYEFADPGLVLNIAAGGEGRNLDWSFAKDPGWTPKLALAMDAAVANRYLQGRESLAIAIARGQVRVRGESRTALLYLPAVRLLCGPYRRVVEADFPGLAAED